MTSRYRVQYQIEQQPPVVTYVEAEDDDHAREIALEDVPGATLPTVRDVRVTLAEVYAAYTPSLVTAPMELQTSRRERVTPAGDHAIVETPDGTFYAAKVAVIPISGLYEDREKLIEVLNANPSNEAPHVELSTLKGT